jgi:hypothetical protein
MKALRRVASVLLAAVSFLALPANSTSFSTDQSDLWYIVAESGWGMQLVQRGDVIFATMFVYGPTGTPTWYVAVMEPTPPGSLVWSGDLLSTTGPWFGTVPFNPALVTETKVGTMTWTARTTNTGNVFYSVNGVAVSKDVVRQTLVFDDYSGTYLAALHVAVTGCSDPTENLPPTDFPVLFTVTVTQSGASMTITISTLGMLGLTIAGTLGQSGQFGALTGTYFDSTGEVGNASVSAMNVQVNALTASFSQSSTNRGCQSVGYLAGMRSQP